MALDTATVRIAAKVAGEEAVRSLARQLNITDKEARSLIRTNLQLGSSSTQAAAGLTGTSRAAAASARGFAAARAAIAATVASFGALAAAAGLGSLGRLGMDAEAAAAKLRTMKNSISDFDKLGPLLQQVARETGNTVGPAELSAGAYEVLSAGATSAADAAAKLKASLILAQGGAVDASVAVDGLTSIMNAYAVDTSRATEVADKVRQTVDDGKISFEQYATTIGRAAAVAAGAGVSLDELNAAIGTVTSGGIVAETAISGVRQLIVNLIKPTDDAKQVAAAYGIQLGAAALKAKGLGGVLDDIRSKTGGNAQAVSKLITDVDGLTAAQALFVKDGQKYKDLLDNQAEAYGRAGKAAEEMNNTAQAAGKRLAAAWERLAERLTKAWAPFFTWLADSLSAVMDKSYEAGQWIQTQTRNARNNLPVQPLTSGTTAGRLPGGMPAIPSTAKPSGGQAFGDVPGGIGATLPPYGAPARQSASDFTRRASNLITGANGVQMTVFPLGPLAQQKKPKYDPIDGRKGDDKPLPPGAEDSGSKGPKERTPAEIAQSVAGLGRDLAIRTLEAERIKADEQRQATIDYEIAVIRANDAFVEFTQRQGVKAAEVAAAKKLRDVAVQAAIADRDAALTAINASIAQLEDKTATAAAAFARLTDRDALLPQPENSFEAQVQQRSEELAAAVRDSITELEGVLKELERKGAGAADLRRKVLDQLTQMRGMTPAETRGLAVEQVRRATAASLGLEQQRELQQLQDQFQALLTPYGELTAQQQLENRSKREGIALSPEDRAQRFQEAAAIDRTKEAIRQLNEQQQLSRQLAEDIADGFREMFKGLLFQAQSLEEALSNLFGRMADQLLDIGMNFLMFGNPMGFNGSLFGIKLPGLAAGGPVSAGAPIVVGERGPEVFVPRSSGTIVPNGAGGVSVVVNVDAKGTSVQGNEPNSEALGRVISASVQAEIIRQRRPGGLLAAGA